MSALTIMIKREVNGDLHESRWDAAALAFVDDGRAVAPLVVLDLSLCGKGRSKVSTQSGKLPKASPRRRRNRVPHPSRSTGACPRQRHPRQSRTRSRWAAVRRRTVRAGPRRAARRARREMRTLCALDVSGRIDVRRQALGAMICSLLNAHKNRIHHDAGPQQTQRGACRQSRTSENPVGARGRQHTVGVTKSRSNSSISQRHRSTLLQTGAQLCTTTHGVPLMSRKRAVLSEIENFRPLSDFAALG